MYKNNRILLILLQLLAKTFFSNIIIYQIIWVSAYSMNTFENCLKWVIYINTLQSPCIAWPYRFDRNGMLLKLLRILIRVLYFKDQNWISKTVYFISCSMTCRKLFYSKFPDIPDKAGRVTNRRTQAIAKRFTQTQ